MLTTTDTGAPLKQRELLTRLDELTDLQTQALNSGDLLALARLSESRAQAVRDAAAFVPPAMPWAPEMTDLALHVKTQSDELQQSIRACMTAVRKELVALTERQRVTHYLAPGTGQREARWQI